MLTPPGSNTVLHESLARTRLLWVLAAMVLPLASCSAAAQEESRVKSVEARIDGLTCPTCVPPLTNSLHRHFDKAKIEVDDEKDTATVQFDEKQAFSDDVFRQAATDVRMNVVYYRIQACGRIEASGSERWLKAGTNRFLVKSDQELPVDKPLCIDGRLDPSKQPAMFEVSAFELQH
jgi:copper chaperone CopZ